MRVELDNITPDETLDVSRPKDDRDFHLFHWAEHHFEGDVSLISEGNHLVLPRAKFMILSTGLMAQAFDLNFRDEASSGMRIPTQPSGTYLEMNLKGQKVELTFYIDYTDFIIHNGHKYTGSEITGVVSHQITYDLITFNRLCGAVYEKCIGFMEERLSHIDGVREYFSGLHLYEGFDDLEYNKP